jgi:hypothetical protein
MGSDGGTVVSALEEAVDEVPVRFSQAVTVRSKTTTTDARPSKVPPYRIERVSRVMATPPPVEHKCTSLAFPI